MSILTPDTIAIGIAKRVARVGDFDTNIALPFIKRGITLAEEGAFTLAMPNGQTFRVAVSELTAGAR